MNIDKYYTTENVPRAITAMLDLTNDQLSLEEMWALMDLAWATTNADSGTPQTLADFYAHPVWTLNGIFTETHEESVYNRTIFANRIAETQPERIADYGGGFGALARLLAKRLPQTSIEIIEPYPAKLALSLCKDFPNIHFVNQLSGIYDVIVALDVLEHVPYPLDLVYKFTQYINKSSYLFLANCFYPVIKCHLPCTFYLRDWFDFLTKKMGLLPSEKILYARMYHLGKKVRNPHEIRLWITLAKILFAGKNSLRELYHGFKTICN